MGSETGDLAGPVIPSGNPCTLKYQVKLTENRQNWIDSLVFQIPVGKPYQLRMTQAGQCGLMVVGCSGVHRGSRQYYQMDLIPGFQRHLNYSKLSHRFYIF